MASMRIDHKVEYMYMAEPMSSRRGIRVERAHGDDPN